MLSKTKYLALSLSLALLPTLAFAEAEFGGAGYFKTMSETFATVISNLIPAFMGLGFIAFFWFLFKYITSKGEDKSKEKAGLMWSVIAIVIMISIFGLASLLQNIFGASGGTGTVTAPRIDTSVQP